MRYLLFKSSYYMTFTDEKMTAVWCLCQGCTTVRPRKWLVNDSEGDTGLCLKSV